MAGRELVFCLLLMLQFNLSGQNCPPYPRAIDQVYVCCGSNAAFGQNASIHNPIRFKFGTFPNYDNYKVEVDFKDGQGYQLCNSGEIKTIAYPAGSSGQITIEWKIFWTTGNPPNEIDHYTSGQHVHQLNFNDEVNYADYLTGTPWGNITGDTYTPPASNAYPPGSPYNNPVSGGGIVHILYANPDLQLRKPFILVEGFDPIDNLDEYIVNDPQGQLLGYGRLRWDVIVTGRNESFDVDPTDPLVPRTPLNSLCCRRSSSKFEAGVTTSFTWVLPTRALICKPMPSFLSR